MVQASATAHGAAAIVDGRQQVGNHHGGLKQRLAVHGHQHGLLAEVVTAGATSRSSLTPKLAQSLATLPMFRGPAGSTSTTTAFKAAAQLRVCR